MQSTILYNTVGLGKEDWSKCQGWKHNSTNLMFEIISTSLRHDTKATVRKPKSERYGPMVPNVEGHKIISKYQIQEVDELGKFE